MKMIVFVALLLVSVKAASSPVSLGLSFQAGIEKEIDNKDYREFQKTFSPYVSYEIDSYWDIVWELSFRQESSTVADLGVSTKTHETMLWGRYHLVSSGLWNFFVGLGTGAYQTEVKTRWSSTERTDKGQMYWQLGSLLGIGGEIFENINGDAQVRVYYPFPDEVAQVRFVFSLAYNF